MRVVCSAEEEVERLRRMFWLRHGCAIWSLYGDDGEMQCGYCRIDFKRDSIETLERAFLGQAKQ